jgi:hypothetical protein
VRRWLRVRRSAPAAASSSSRVSPEIWLLRLEQRLELLAHAEEQLVLPELLVAVGRAGELARGLLELLGGLLLLVAGLGGVARAQPRAGLGHRLARLAGRLLEGLVGQLGETLHEVVQPGLQLVLPLRQLLERLGRGRRARRVARALRLLLQHGQQLGQRELRRRLRGGGLLRLVGALRLRGLHELVEQLARGGRAARGRPRG